MTLVYILNTYGEYGPEEIRASLSSEDIFRALEKDAANWIESATKANVLHLDSIKTSTFNAKQKCRKHLTENQTGSYELSDGWGGYQLHIVELVNDPVYCQSG